MKSNPDSLPASNIEGSLTMDTDRRTMMNRINALYLLEQERQQRLSAALASWQPFFAQQAQVAETKNDEQASPDNNNK